MKLKNPFSNEIRLLYLDCWYCFECGGNGQDCGGLEIHHITGRDSKSALNSSVLCKRCHGIINHSKEEEKRIYKKTEQYLLNKRYKLTSKDLSFLKDHPHLIT